MTDAELMARLTEVPRERLDAELRELIDDSARCGVSTTIYEVSGFPAPSPVLIIHHRAPTPSMAAIRASFDSITTRRNA